MDAQRSLGRWGAASGAREVVAFDVSAANAERFVAAGGKVLEPGASEEPPALRVFGFSGFRRSEVCCGCVG